MLMRGKGRLPVLTSSRFISRSVAVSLIQLQVVLSVVWKTGVDAQLKQNCHGHLVLFRLPVLTHQLTYIFVFRGACYLHHHRDDGDSKLLLKVCKLRLDYTALQPVRQKCTYWSPWDSEISLKPWNVRFEMKFTQTDARTKQLPRKATKSPKSDVRHHLFLTLQGFHAFF